MNLFLLHEHENAFTLINDSGFKVNGSTLYEANLKRILALLYYNKVEIIKALDTFREVMNSYNDLNCVYG
jgi:hypothetical protein